MTTLRKISSRDVALKAGVSQTTVSYVLSGRENIAIPDATRKRVLEAAADLGYRANSSAKAMRSGRFGSVSLLLSENPSMSILPSERLEGILDALEAVGMHLIVSRFADAALADREQMPRILRELMADGLLINYNTNLPDHMAERIAQNCIPAVWVNSKQDADCVYPDDWDAARRATETLLELGHRRIAFATHTGTTHYSYEDRMNGYTQAMIAAGLAPQRLETWRELPALPARNAVISWLNGNDAPTAILTYATETASLIFAAALALGLNIPADLSLLTFNARPVDLFGPTLATMLLPEREIGRNAVEMLLAKIKTPEQTFAPASLACELLAGDTLASPQAKTGRR